MAKKDLWKSNQQADWKAAADRYASVIEAQGVSRLVELDAWYREELPQIIADRDPPHITLADMEKVTEWKMARGVWRQRNLNLVRSNPAATVISASKAALRATADAATPIRLLAKLKGVGPATASAVVAAASPSTHAFFDDLVADQIPGLGDVQYTMPYYGKYLKALRDKAVSLAGEWTPSAVEQALWANSGGKAGVS